MGEPVRFMPAEEETVMSFPAYLRDGLRWFPTINYSLCGADLGCLNSCPNDVFGWDRGSRRPFVLDPHNCSAGCDLCLQACTRGAISLPTREQWLASLRRMRLHDAPSPAYPHRIRWGC